MKSLNKILKNLDLNNIEIPEVLVSGLSTNSKNVKKGDLFIAIKGNKAIIPELPEEPAYIEQRKNEYPSMDEQLDMQYWDSVNGTTTWKDAIKAVKDKYPKE